MIDDLIHQGISEPYRMFTSRAEFRLSLREDNADLRLRPIARDLGLIDEAEYQRFLDRKKRLDTAKVYLSKTFIKPSEALNDKLASLNSSPMHSAQTLANVLKRPEVGLNDIIPFSPVDHFGELTSEDMETLEVEIKFDGYINIQKQEIERLGRMQELEIPADFDFEPLPGISFEVKEKLTRHRPNNLAEASRLPGITPAALTALMGHLKAREKFAKESHPSI
jgi:tRNA uridine 5-carboxymethylaminomethyl modification enzyme